MMYGQNAILVNEFLGHSWRQVLQNATEPLGVEVLKSRGFFPDAYWYWLGLLRSLKLLYERKVKTMQMMIKVENPFSLTGELYLKKEKYLIWVLIGEDKTIVGANQSRKKGMILPFKQHSITFDEIKYSEVEDRLMLLKGISGAFRPGVLTALMGFSGAGKTTLMDVLAGRKTGGSVEGKITISSYPKKQETFARISGYCEQNDIHSPHITVYESLLYSAWLRLSPEVTYETRKMFIEEVMELVELTPLRETIVELPGVNGFATEQRKRLTIAVDLVANPSIIFMDEPTSGLDARAATIVMRTVRNTIDTGRTVVCTIHQPSIDIFEAFDELFLMKRGGEEIYVGPLGIHSCHLIKCFEEIEEVGKIKDGYNPATWMLEITSSARELVLGIDFSEVYKSSELYSLVVAVERTVFYRERAAGMYSTMPYAFAQVIIELPYVFAQAAVYGVIVYAMIGFEWTVTKFFWYLFFMYFSLLYFTLYGMMAVAVTPNHHIAAIIASGFYSMWNIFSGFIIPRTRIPIHWRWYYWACPVSWTLYGLVASQFGDIKDKLDDANETVEDFLRNYFGFRHDFVGVDAAVVVGFTIIFTFTFAFSIKAFNFQRR
ncbi:unnamed protein product [Camellia sinensis]